MDRFFSHCYFSNPIPFSRSPENAASLRPKHQNKGSREGNENIGACDNIQIVHISKQILHGHSFTSETEITESRKPKLCEHINIQ